MFSAMVGGAMGSGLWVALLVFGLLLWFGLLRGGSGREGVLSFRFLFSFPLAWRFVPCIYLFLFWLLKAWLDFPHIGLAFSSLLLRLR